MPKPKQPLALAIDSPAALPPSYNLWTEPWITLEHKDGGMEEHGIEFTLLHAHKFLAIYDASPLVIVGIHRLLTAILQDALDDPYLQDEDELRALWRTGCFPPEKVAQFGQAYAARFDLFSPDQPFMQSGDLPMTPQKGDALTSVSKLFPEIPTGQSEVTHYRHTSDNEQVLCPAMVAAGLVAMPAFVSSQGRGLAPSINGVPPLYVLPGGRSLFDSLVAGLLLPLFRPRTATKKQDGVWWKRNTQIARDKEVIEVGYLQSLTFPARRVRFHPQIAPTTCARSGRNCEVNVRTMIFEMGERRPKDSTCWQDPFVAYRLPEVKKSSRRTVSKPTKKQADVKPIRPMQGRSTWREFVGLFLQQADDKQRTIRPLFIKQMAELGLAVDQSVHPFRCISIQTDGKAKNFEWIDFGFDIPPTLLNDPTGAEWTAKALKFTNDCERIAALVFRQTFGGSAKVERYSRLKANMIEEYWAELADPFRYFILAMGEQTKQSITYQRWLDTVLEIALAVFSRASEAVGDDAANLQKRTHGEQRCEIKLKARRKKEFPDE